MRTASQAVLVVMAFLCVAIPTTAATAQTPPTIPCAGAFGTCLGSCPAGQQCIPDPTTTLCGCVTVTTTTLSSTTTTTSSVTTTTLAACCGFSPKPSELSFTTSIGAGNRTVASWYDGRAGRRSAPLDNHVAEGEVHAGSNGTARLRHPVPPPRDGVARDEQQAPGGEVLGGARAGGVTELEAAGRAEARRGDVRLATVGVVAVTVPSHGVAAIAIEIREHRVEHAARDGLDAPANHLEPRCKAA